MDVCLSHPPLSRFADSALVRKEILAMMPSKRCMLLSSWHTGHIMVASACMHACHAVRMQPNISCVLSCLSKKLVSTHCIT